MIIPMSEPHGQQTSVKSWLMLFERTDYAFGKFVPVTVNTVLCKFSQGYKHSGTFTESHKTEFKLQSSNEKGCRETWNHYCTSSYIGIVIAAGLPTDFARKSIVEQWVRRCVRKQTAVNCAGELVAAIPSAS
ncbi:hypothetical protein BaRGS_00002705 [Batillaria attramentaria]|uniref:Uncharacterized protein n=1 Tax=Batillaria attramentaria TaxID=370345 RepID=A0ABD0M401_9CAEN